MNISSDFTTPLLSSWSLKDGVTQLLESVWRAPRKRRQARRLRSEALRQHFHQQSGWLPSEDLWRRHSCLLMTQYGLDES